MESEADMLKTIPSDLGPGFQNDRNFSNEQDINYINDILNSVDRIKEEKMKEEQNMNENQYRSNFDDLGTSIAILRDMPGDALAMNIVSLIHALSQEFGNLNVRIEGENEEDNALLSKFFNHIEDSVTEAYFEPRLTEELTIMGYESPEDSRHGNTEKP